MKPLIILLCTLGMLACTDRAGTSISDREDYDHYLGIGPAETTSKYFALWESKIKPDSLQLTSFGIVAGQYSNYFQATGDINYLKKAEKALEKAVEIAAIGKADYYRALARNYISQHRFRESLALAEKASSMGSGVRASRALLFDIHMELGHYAKAQGYLDSLKNMSDFDYLIRLAKWNDHQGDLDTALRFMEKAALLAEEANNRDLKLWTYANLADFYGHAGRIRDSYIHYLKALSVDPHNAYSKKGIAWIVFSHERNPEEALRILDSVTRHCQSPDYFLLKADIAAYMDDHRGYLHNMGLYYGALKDPGYGDMYNSQRISLYLGEARQFDRALQLAEKEVENRPTPLSYDLLAYSHFKGGNLPKALEIVEEHIRDKTFEPLVLLHIAEIYKETGRSDEAKALKKELLGSLYELGPAAEDQIRDL